MILCKQQPVSLVGNFEETDMDMDIDRDSSATPDQIPPKRRKLKNTDNFEVYMYNYVQ